MAYADSQALRTDRLVLLPLQQSDLNDIIALHASPAVADWLGGVMTREACASAVKLATAAFQREGWGLYALRMIGGRFVGVAGLQYPSLHIPALGVEAVWRLHEDAWGFGYAVEAMTAILERHADLAPNIFAVTAVANQRSRRTMQRLGFTHDPTEDFEHPALPEHHPLRAHVAYRYADPKSSV